MCGASDCRACRPGTWQNGDDDSEEGESTLASRMEAAGYNGGAGHWYKVVRTKLRRARKAYTVPTGAIAIGEVYREVTRREVGAAGYSRHKLYRRKVAS